MIWICVGVELIMLGLILIQYFKEKQKSATVKMGISALIQGMGAQIVSILPCSKKRQEKNQIYQIMCKLAGDDEGEILFQEYRRKRWGLIFGVMLLMNTVGLLQLLQPEKTDVMFEIRQDRPEYGQGDRSQQVTVVLDGEDKAEGTILLKIPQKEVSSKEAKRRVQEGLAYVKDILDGQQIKGDIELPAEWNEVALYYESFSPELLSNSGKWGGEIQEEANSITMKVTAVMGEESQTETITFFTATLAQLSAEERLALVLKKTAEGEFLTENELILPDTTETGERLTWIETRESGKMIWILLGGILLLFVLWHQDQEYKQQLNERDKKIRQSYPEFMNELVILAGAGLSLPAAWHRIGQDYKKKRLEGGNMDPLYEEIYRESCEMEAGTAMREVLEDFAGHMRFKEARRFAVLLTQNLKRGDAFLLSRLKELNQEAWDLRKKQVREKTEEADTKLLLPLMLMLAVILIIVLSPAMITMQV